MPLLNPYRFAAGINPLTNLVTRFRANSGVAVSGANVTSWTDDIGGLVLGTVAGTVVLNATGNPVGGPQIEFPSGSGIRNTASIGASPTGANNRTMYFVVDYPSSTNDFSGVMYGSAVSNQAFGICMANNAALNKLVGDYWVNSLTVGASILANTMRTYALSQNSTGPVQTAYDNGTPNATTGAQVLNTGTAVFAFGRNVSTGDTTSNPMNVCACYIYNVCHTPAEVAAITALLNDDWIS